MLILDRTQSSSSKIFASTPSNTCPHRRRKTITMSPTGIGSIQRCLQPVSCSGKFHRVKTWAPMAESPSDPKSNRKRLCGASSQSGLHDPSSSTPCVHGTRTSTPHLFIHSSVTAIPQTLSLSFISSLKALYVSMYVPQILIANSPGRFDSRNV